MGSTRLRRGLHGRRNRCRLSWKVQTGKVHMLLPLLWKIVEGCSCGDAPHTSVPLVDTSHGGQHQRVALIVWYFTPCETFCGVHQQQESVSPSSKQMRNILFVQPPGPGATPEGAPCKHEWNIFRSIVRGVSGSNSNTAGGIGRNCACGRWRLISCKVASFLGANAAPVNSCRARENWPRWMRD